VEEKADDPEFEPTNVVPQNITRRDSLTDEPIFIEGEQLYSPSTPPDTPPPFRPIDRLSGLTDHAKAVTSQIMATVPIAHTRDEHKNFATRLVSLTRTTLGKEAAVRYCISGDLSEFKREFYHIGGQDERLHSLIAKPDFSKTTAKEKSIARMLVWKYKSSTKSQR
jgi:hypothetical protein